MVESQTTNGEKVHQVIVDEIRWRFLLDSLLPQEFLQDLIRIVDL